VSVAVVVAVFLSNLPEALSASTGLVSAGSPDRRSSGCRCWWRS
jgi:hypothetical protein